MQIPSVPLKSLPFWQSGRRQGGVDGVERGRGNNLDGGRDPTGKNRQRDELCKDFDLEDITDGEGKVQIEGRPTQPIAEAYFSRGQNPIRAVEGDTVINDLEGCIAKVREGWDSPSESRILEGISTPGKRPFVWSLVMLDLAFLTGRVLDKTAGKKEERGIPNGEKGDHDEASYFGLELLEALRREFPKLPVVIFSSMSKTSHLTKKYEAGGAKVFINKKPERFWEYLQEFGLLRDNHRGEFQIVGGSRPLLLALREARNSRGDDDAVLIRGETGRRAPNGATLRPRYCGNVAGRGGRKFPGPGFGASRQSNRAALLEENLD